MLKLKVEKIKLGGKEDDGPTRYYTSYDAD